MSYALFYKFNYFIKHFFTKEHRSTMICPFHTIKNNFFIFIF